MNDDEIDGAEELEETLRLAREMQEEICNVLPLLSDEECDRALQGLDSAAFSTATAHGAIEIRPGELIDRYRVVEPIGAGGMGTVWLAEQIEPVQRPVALKVLHAVSPSAHQVAVERFEFEHRILARLEHENLPRFLDSGVHRGRHYFAMEYVAGRRVTTYCQDEALSLTARLELFRQVLKAVAHIHQSLVLHRDLKPENILVVDRDGPVVKVVDLGLAKDLDGGGEPLRTFLTTAGATPGSYAYMAPEQTEPDATLDTRADVYALGIVLYELLVDAHPYMDELAADPKWTICSVTPRRPSAVADGARSRQLRGDLDEVTMKAIDKEPAARYAAVSELENDLRRYLNGERVTACPPSWVARRYYGLRRMVRKHSSAIVAIAATLVVTAVVLSVVGYVRRVRTGALDLEVVFAGIAAEPVLGSGARGASVDIDGERKLNAPLEGLELPVGRHVLEVRELGWFRRTLELGVDEERTKKESVTLEQGIEWDDVETSLQSRVEVVEDIDGDGIEDLAIALLRELRIRSGRTGGVIGTWPVASKSRWVFRHGRLDEHRGLCFVAFEQGPRGTRVVCIDAGRRTDQVLWDTVLPNAREGTGDSCVITDDLDGDGTRDVAGLDAGARFFALGGAAGDVLFVRSTGYEGIDRYSVGLLGPREMAFWGQLPRGTGVVGVVRLDRDEGVAWSCELARLRTATRVDVDGDGDHELWCLLGRESLVLDGSTGDRLSSAPLPFELDPNAFPMLVRKPSAVVGVFTYSVAANETRAGGLDLTTGRRLWEVHVGNGSRRAAAVLPGGRVFVGGDFGGRVFDALRGTERPQLAGALPVGQAVSGVHVDDCDADGEPEILVGLAGLGLACFDERGSEEWMLPLDSDSIPAGVIRGPAGSLPRIALLDPEDAVGCVRPPTLVWRRPAGTVRARGVATRDGRGELRWIFLGKARGHSDPGGGVYCVDGRTGREIWTQAHAVPPNRAPALADWNGDGIDDVIALADGEMVALSTRDGSVIDSIPVPDQTGERVYATPLIADLNGDGRLDFVVPRYGDRVGDELLGRDVLALDGAKRAVLWKFPTPAPNVGGVALVNRRDDSRAVIAPSTDGHVFAIDALSGAERWRTRIDGEGPAKSPGVAAPAVAVFEPGGPEWIVGAFADGGVWMLDADSGEIAHRFRVPGATSASGRPAVVDVDDSVWIVASLGETGVGAFDGRSRTRRWLSTDLGGAVSSELVVCDVDGDRRREVVAVTTGGKLVVLDLLDGCTLWSLKFTSFSVSAAPAVADLDDDSVLDIVIGDHGGAIHAIRGRRTSGLRGARRSSR